MSLKIETIIKGDIGTVKDVLEFYAYKFPGILSNALKKESRVLTKEIQRNLKRGGSPSFKSISPFTKAVRRAMGVRGNKSGVSTKQLLKAIRSTKIDNLSFFSGVHVSSPDHKNNRGLSIKMHKIAYNLENGRDKYYIHLDRKGRSGKTPRQWLWWLFFSGAIKSPPKKNTTHIEIRKQPSRPFVGQVFNNHSTKSVNNFLKYIEEAIVRST